MLHHFIMEFAYLSYFAIASAGGTLMSVRKRSYIFKT